MFPTLSVVLIQEEGWWVAQALERDFAAQGRTMERALDELAAAIATRIAWAQHHNIDPATAVPPAPPYCSQWYADSKMTVLMDSGRTIRASFEQTEVVYHPEVRVRLHERPAVAVGQAA